MSSIKSKYFSSSFWVIVGRGSSNLSSFLIFALLARFLGPLEFGLVALASVFVDIARALAAAGITQALVQRPEWDQRVASTAFWTNILFSLALAVIMGVAGAPLLGWILEPRLAPIIAALSAVYVIDAARGAHEALLQREFKFRQLATRTLLATIIGGIAGVIMAFYGFGAWALVGSRIVNSVMQTIVVWTAVRWRPSFQFSRAEAKALLGFGIHLSGAGIVGELNGRTPELVIGWFLGPTAVGFYRVGGRAINMITDVVIRPMQSTTLAALSRLKDPEAKGRAYLRLIKACSILSIPTYFGAAAIGPDFVVVCFGSKWEASGLVMAMLATAGAASTIGFFSQPVLTAVGRTDAAFIMSLGTLIGNFLVALVTVNFGLTWVALGVSVRGYMTVPLGLHFLTRATGLRIRDVLFGMAPPVASAVVMVALLLAGKAFLLESLHPIVRLAVMVPAGAVIYAACMSVVGRKLLIEVGNELAPIFSRFGLRFGRRADPAP